MKYATTFTAVQKALGVEINAVTETAFRQADEKYADRLRVEEKKNGQLVGLFVDNVLVVVVTPARTISNPPQNVVDQFLSI
jgi:hypothetical protein